MDPRAVWHRDRRRPRHIGAPIRHQDCSSSVAQSIGVHHDVVADALDRLDRFTEANIELIRADQIGQGNARGRLDDPHAPQTRAE